MSVTAAARHVARAHDPTGHVTRVAPVGSAAPGSTVDAIQTAVSLVATFVPTSIVAAYIALTALIGENPVNPAIKIVSNIVPFTASRTLSGIMPLVRTSVARSLGV